MSRRDASPRRYNDRMLNRRKNKRGPKTADQGRKSYGGFPAHGQFGRDQQRIYRTEVEAQSSH